MTDALPNSMSKAQLVGWARGEVKVNTTGTGKKVANFSVYTGKAGTFRCVAWEDLAEKAYKEVHNGTRVLIDGRLANRKYTDGSGDHWITEVTASTLEIIDTTEAPSF